MLLYSRGTGQYNACRALILERLNKGGCSSPANCSVDSVYQPSVNGLSLKFLAISAFYSSFNTLAPLIPLSANADKNFDLATMNFSQLFTAIRNVCTQPWSAINTSDYLYRPCKFSRDSAGCSFDRCLLQFYVSTRSIIGHWSKTVTRWMMATLRIFN